jgi:peptidoglycan/LPS O-acetylase OafA/YrhL
LAVWNRIYFGSDTRADGLLAGCIAAIALVALLPRIGARSRRVLACAAVGAAFVVVVIVSRALGDLSGWMPTWGLPLLEASIAIVIVGVIVAPGAPLARILAFPLFAWIGRRSYAIYLFHPVVFRYCDRRHVHLPPSESFVFQMLVILAAAEVSYRVIEAPMLRRKLRYAALGDT